MGRRGRRGKETFRVYGPKDLGGGRSRPWRVIYVSAGVGGEAGERAVAYYATEALAKAGVAKFLREAEQLTGLTVMDAIDVYLRDCKDRGLREITLYHTGLLLRNVFRGWEALPLTSLDAGAADEIFWGKRNVLGALDVHRYTSRANVPLRCPRTRTNSDPQYAVWLWSVAGRVWVRGSGILS